MATKTKEKTASKKKAPDLAATSGQLPNAGNTGNAQTGDEPQAFPTLDVDVADVDPGKGKGETGPVILAGYWVRLAEHDDVPDRFVGHLAAVVESPWAPAPIGVPHSGISGYTFDEDAKFVVRTRDEANALLTIDADAIQASAQDRVDLQPYA